MREIIFRGKRLDNGLWVSSGNLIQFTEGREAFIPDADSRCMARHDEETDDIVELWNARFRKVDPETVGQFTGLHDKNGEKIFEGDILEDCVGDKFWVYWENDDCQYCKSTCGDGTPIETSFDWFDAKHLEIRGNIYDNPEFLEVTDHGI